MSRTKDIIDERPGAVEIAKSEPKDRKVIPRPQENNEDIENDYKYQRKTLQPLEKGTDAIEGILEIAKESEHPRTYEVVVFNQTSRSYRNPRTAREDEEIKRSPKQRTEECNKCVVCWFDEELQKMLKVRKMDNNYLN